MVISDLIYQVKIYTKYMVISDCIYQVKIYTKYMVISDFITKLLHKTLQCVTEH